MSRLFPALIFRVSSSIIEHARAGLFRRFFLRTNILGLIAYFEAGFDRAQFDFPFRYSGIHAEVQPSGNADIPVIGVHTDGVEESDQSKLMLAPLVGDKVRSRLQSDDVVSIFTQCPFQSCTQVVVDSGG
jgi:hypothetical protein